MLFAASEALPPYLTIVNLSLAGDHQSRGMAASYDGDAGDRLRTGVGCTLPLSDYERIAQSLLSPLIAFLLLAVVLMAQLVWRACLSAATSSSERAMSVDGAGNGDSKPVLVATRLYHLLFSPSRVKYGAQIPATRSSAVLVVPRLQSPLLSNADRSLQNELASSPALMFPFSAHASAAVSNQSPHCLHLSSILLWYQRTCVRLLLLSYIPISVLCLSYFAVQGVGSYGNRLVDYPTISPSSRQYTRAVLLMALLIAGIAFGIPVAVCALLAREYRHGKLTALLAEAEAANSSKPGQESELLLSPRSFLPRGAQMPSMTLAVRMRSALLLQLCAMYRPQYWWYAVFILVRRLILVTALVFCQDAQVWILMTTINTVLLTIHLVLQPYRTNRDNVTETVTLLSLTAQTIVLSRWPPPYMSDWLLSVMLSLVIGPLLYMVMVAVLERWRQLRRKGWAAFTSFADVECNDLRSRAKQSEDGL